MAEGFTPCYAMNNVTDPRNWTGIKNSNGKYSCSYTSSNSEWNAITCDFNANGYRLPTEAEGEFAARGGTKAYETTVFTYYFAGVNTTNYTASTNSDLEYVAWYKNNSDDKSLEIRSKKTHSLGLYDMSGNVWEWCWDWYGNISSNTVKDPCGVSSGTDRVDRGGSWSCDAVYCSICYRDDDGDPGDFHHKDLGFRVVSSAR